MSGSEMQLPDDESQVPWYIEIGQMAGFLLGLIGGVFLVVLLLFGPSHARPDLYFTHYICSAVATLLGIIIFQLTNVEGNTHR